MAGYDSVRVVCRFRPINQREKNEGQADVIVDILDCNKQVRFKGKRTQKTHIFTFDRAFKPNASQQDIFEHTGALLIDQVLQGINCTLFAYGQTGSGKTHTMEGQIGSLENEGLIPRMVRKLFDSIQNMQDDVRYALRVSYVEIYNEKLRDLLNPSLTPRVRGGVDGRNIKVENGHEQYVSTPEQVFELLYAGHSNRSVSATKMNSASSRSHAVFMLYIDREESNGTTKKSKLLMVDLAGSEKVKKTEAKGALLEEAKNINQSLSTLGNVINALTKEQHHIPYRDSVLTRLLSDALGGNSKTMLIIAASPALFNGDETLSTLRFGKRAKEIKNRVAVNEELSIEQYKARLAAAKLKISKLEQENDILKKKVKEMMMVSHKSNDKQLVLKFETIVKNVDLNPSITPKEPIYNKHHKKNKLGHHSRNKSVMMSSLTLGAIKNNNNHNNKKQNKMSRSMSVQINDETLMGLNNNNNNNSPIYGSMDQIDQISGLSLNADNSLEKDAEILSLKKKLSEVTEELNRAENAERVMTDAKAELYEGHLQLREEFEEQNEKLKQMELHNDTIQTKIDALQTLLDDSKLRTIQIKQQFESKEKSYIAKCEKLHKDILTLKQQSNIKRFIGLTTQKKRDNDNNGNNNDNNNNNGNNKDIDDKKLDDDIMELSSKLLQNADTTKKHELQAIYNKSQELQQKHKLLHDRYKKMSEILKCYKERDKTNYALRKAWTKHMNALEKALCHQDAATLRWREQSKSHEEILKTEIERLRNNIKHFQHFKRYGTSSPNLLSSNPMNILNRRSSQGSMASMPSSPMASSPMASLSGNKQQQHIDDADTASVTSANSYALHQHQRQQQQQQQHHQQQQHQQQIIQPAPQYVQSYSHIQHPTFISGGPRLANIQNPQYIIPTYKYIQTQPQTPTFTMSAMPQNATFTVNAIPQIRTHHHPHQYVPSQVQQPMQQIQPHEY